MASKIYSTPRVREFTSSGTVLNGGKLYFYLAGTTTPATVYTSSAMTTAHAHPVLATTAGLFPAIWLAAGVSYDVTCKNSAGAVQWTALNYSDALTSAEVGQALYPRTTAEIAAGVTPTDYRYQSGDVRRYGAVGGGADDTLAVQTALNLGGVVDLGGLTCSVARNIAGSDRYGVYAAVSNTTIRNGTLKRYNTDISTYALAYAPLLVGTPNSNAAAATQDVTLTDSLTIEGNDTRHAVAGAALTDFRDLVHVKNTIGFKAIGTRFTKIDSQAITFQKPGAYDYANSSYFNTTKNYRASITACEFAAEPHSTSARALIHAVEASGVDGLTVSANTFRYCDNCFGGETTYDGPETSEADVYTPTAGWAVAAKPTGRGWSFTGNHIYNSSEVAIYPAGVDVAVVGNTIHCDSDALVADAPIKIRCRGATVCGNVISGYPLGITITTPSIGVTVTGNTIRLSETADAEAGAIDISSYQLSNYIDDRSDYLLAYKPMGGITITGNVIEFPQAAATATNKQSAFRIRTNDTADANYPEGQLIGVTIVGNTIKAHNIGLYVVGPEFRSVAVTGNTFSAKSFVSSGFAGGTTLNTRAVLQVNVSLSATQLRNIRFDNNIVHGATYLFATTTGGGGAGTFEMPWGMTGNRLDYIKNIKTADVAAFSTWNNFRHNTGTCFLDRTWDGEAMENALADGTGSANSQRRYTTIWTGAAYRFYTDDAGTFVTL